MPLVSMRCPDGEEVSFDHCLEQCENRCTPFPVSYAIIKENENSFHTGNKITATSIIGCLRKTYLERTRPFADTFENLWYSFRGGALHSSLEVLKGDMRWLIEHRFEGEIAGIKISGQVDAYDKMKRHLLDYKSTKDKSLPYIMNNGAKKEHLIQASIYGVLLEDHDRKVDRASIVYLSMERVYACDDIMIYSRETVEKYVSLYGGMLQRAFDNGTIPDTPDPRPHWLCAGYCPVSKYCEEIDESVR